MKIDCKKELSALYRPAAKKIVEVDVPEMSFLMVDGQGSPGRSESFVEAIEVLFSVAYTLKFIVKNGTHGIDYSVMPLEGLWWADDMSAFAEGDRQALHEFIAAWGGQLSGRHHEIYLSDLRRTSPAKLRTIIRQPFLPSEAG